MSLFKAKGLGKIPFMICLPMTQKGFRANFSLPLHPRYRQQHPADQILTMYSTPNTTIVTISYTHTQVDKHHPVT